MMSVMALARRLLGVVLPAVGAAGLLAGQTLGQGADPSSVDPPFVDAFERLVLPVLSGTCVTCHNNAQGAAGLSFEAFRDAATASEEPEIWRKVLEKLDAGQMPPPPLAPLSPSDREAVTDWIRGLPAVQEALAGEAVPNPGRVTARRLNRTEYNNTIRDLLGVSLRPADEFPVDDSGYGFDNIGDVLSLSPLLMEKYVAAARAVSLAAVFGEPHPGEPTLLVKLLTKKVQDDLPSRGNITPFALRGALYATFHAPVEADYEFRMRYQNYRGVETVIPDSPAPGARGGADAATPVATAGRQRGRGRGPSEDEVRAREERLRLEAPPVELRLTVDGEAVYSYFVEGSADFNYARGENVVRVRLTPGDHALRASFPEYANVADARTHLNPDGRRKLYVDYMDVVGPFDVASTRPPGYSNIFICGEPGRYEAACAREIVTHLLSRAYRRPVTEQEVRAMLDLVDQVRQRDSFEEAVRVAIEAVLLSPNFLFRIERDPPEASAGDSYEIGDYELASRLSYFLWSSMPDDQLFDEAGKNTLHQPEVLETQVRRMLRDPKSSALVENFGEQWLNLRLMDRTKPDAALFDRVDDELLDAMRQETRMFMSAVFREDRSILDFIDGPFTFVNGPLARYYGIGGVDGEEFRRVDLDGEHRSGIVTQASVLSISSYATRTSPVLRGKWVLDTLLGSAPPPPPAGIPRLEEKDLGTAASLRQRLEQHRADPSCAACHDAMDPIGFGLENYDAAGAWRTADGNFDIDSSGSLPDGRSFDGARDLKQILRDDAAVFARNFTHRLLTYALGRGLETPDQTEVDRISGEIARDDYRFGTLVRLIVNSRPFRMRTGV